MTSEYVKVRREDLRELQRQAYRTSEPENLYSFEALMSRIDYLLKSTSEAQSPDARVERVARVFANYDSMPEILLSHRREANRFVAAFDAAQAPPSAEKAEDINALVARIEAKHGFLRISHFARGGWCVFNVAGDRVCDAAVDQPDLLSALRAAAGEAP